MHGVVNKWGCGFDLMLWCSCYRPTSDSRMQVSWSSRACWASLDAQLLFQQMSAKVLVEPWTIWQVLHLPAPQCAQLGLNPTDWLG